MKIFPTPYYLYEEKRVNWGLFINAHILKNNVYIPPTSLDNP